MPPAPLMFRLPWIDADTALPPPEQALDDPAGLLCAGAPVTTARLIEAYSNGIFPWYSGDQPPLWWSTDPRMVLLLDDFRAPLSLIKTIRSAARQGRWRITLDQAFERVMLACAEPRPEQDGTWITDEIRAAYQGMHERGLAHSIEVWEGELLAGGLYGVSLGRMFYGESMFTRRANASKVALAALVHLLKPLGFRMIDCQQQTSHLAFMGGAVMAREQFLAQMRALLSQPAPTWSTLMTDIHELAQSTRPGPQPT